MIALTSEQLVAYADAVYEVLIDGRWVAAETLCASAPAACRALISACNPYSQPLADDENAIRHHRLQAEIEEDGWRWWPARGRSSDHSWVEPGFLVQAPIAVVDRWAQAYGQHAIWYLHSRQSTATLRIYSRFQGDQAPLRLANLRLEWVGCDPPASG